MADIDRALQLEHGGRSIGDGRCSGKVGLFPVRTPCWRFGVAFETQLHSSISITYDTGRLQAQAFPGCRCLQLAIGRSMRAKHLSLSPLLIQNQACLNKVRLDVNSMISCPDRRKDQDLDQPSSVFKCVAISITQSHGEASQYRPLCCGKCQQRKQWKVGITMVKLQ